MAIPKGIKDGQTFLDAESFSQYLIHNKLLSTVPWDDAGAFIRFSVTFVAPTHEEENRIIQEIGKRLSSEEWVF